MMTLVSAVLSGVYLSLFRRGLVLFAVGVLLALVLNLLQVQRNVTLFPDQVVATLFSSAWWVPLCCGSAAVPVVLPGRYTAGPCFFPAGLSSPIATAWLPGVRVAHWKMQKLRWLACCTHALTDTWVSLISSRGSGPVSCDALLFLWGSTMQVLNWTLPTMSSCPLHWQPFH
ncbi:uncharacterized protein LOC108937503 isoform X3 [Scleropages formosus]|uniref:uncharacterized protein LOC108937503 isoform X3 n=1 Tax=Scleropages formosus TaxID=113540 RepID=UPI000879197C|nr:uncharacterized protein LOC108937503 isoform X3 [Scleropages formosus]